MIGIIGGTGFYTMPGVEGLKPNTVETPFGSPSGPVMTGRLAGRDIAFLPRHGERHQYLPGEINYRANIWALKAAGVRRIISVSAVGSLKKELAPGHLAIASQYMDFTKGRREASFFGNGIIAHISTAEPSCPTLSHALDAGCRKLGFAAHDNATYACVEGPRLGTRAESFFLRNGGASIVGMTNVPESFLAREAQLCYCTLAVVTDYDCWLEDPNEHATVDKIIAAYNESLKRVQDLIRLLMTEGIADGDCRCRKSLEGAIMTREEDLASEQKEIVSFLKE